MDEKDIQEYENDEGIHRYVLRENHMDDIIDATAALVDKEVTRDWNDGLIAEWITRENDAVFALTSEMPPKEITGMGYNCAFSDETQSKIDSYEKANNYKGNWGVLEWNGREIVAFSDIDRYACKIWDWCEQAVYDELEEKHNMTIIDGIEYLESTFA
tara:strand:- start:415 stop:888 length:474 start_codon:yes stop_codon:yes gene_type:complete